MQRTLLQFLSATCTSRFTVRSRYLRPTIFVSIQYMLRKIPKLRASLLPAASILLPLDKMVDASVSVSGNHTLLATANTGSVIARYFFALLVLCMPVLATANYYCAGKITHLGADESLYVSNGFGVHRLCELTDEKCKAWLSFVTAAKLADRNISIYYRNPSLGGQQNDGACRDIGSWVTPNDTVYYIQIQ